MSNIQTPHLSVQWINAAEAEVSSQDVPGTGVGSRWLECLISKLHTSLFSGSILPRLKYLVIAVYKSESSLFNSTMLNCSGIPQANNLKGECLENEKKYKVKKI